MNVGFFVRHFTERGTEVAIYDYAKYNEEILNNKSYIICFTEATQQHIGWGAQRFSYNKFKERFQIIEINDMREMSTVIESISLNVFYTLTGGAMDIYQFENKNIWNNCKTIKHCVFDTRFPESDFYISISDKLNTKNGTNLQVIPHIVDLPECNDNLRAELNIPDEAIVFGRYGGKDQFDLSIAHDGIIQFLNSNTNTYFLFMNTNVFYNHPKIIYLDLNVDVNYKAKFINTCDVMIHARRMGETFGLSIAEFSASNKPIITCRCGDDEHIKILMDRAIIYNSTESLVYIFNNIQHIINTRSDWNAYTNYTPQNVMNLFKSHIFDKI